MNQVSQMTTGFRCRLAAAALAAALPVCAAGCTTSSTTPAHSASASPTPAAGRHTRVSMPSVLGYSGQLAVQTLRTDGLTGPVHQMSKPNLRAPKGSVTGTVPQAQAKVLADSPVTLFVSGGIAQCLLCSRRTLTRTVPSAICGLTLARANILLVEDGITLSPRVLHQASARPAGTVIASAPAVGTPFIAFGSPRAREVVVTVSSGRTGPATPAPSAGGTVAC